MWSPELIIFVTAAFLLGGVVKGVVGLGLPVVALAFLAPTVGLKPAMAIMLVPCLVTNLWQGLVGGALVEILRRIWAMLVTSCLGIWAGVAVLAGTDGVLLAGLLGILLLAYALFNLRRPQVPAPEGWEGWLSPVIGALSGAAFGMTGSYMVPGVLYLQALGLKRDVLVQALGITFIVITAALSVSLARHRLIPPDLGLLSAAALIPTAAGMAIGQRLRHRIPDQHFRTVFFSALAIVGVYMIWRAFL